MRSMCLVLLGVAVMSGRAVAATTAELIEGARTEGKLTWYTSMRVEDSQPLLNAFMAKYPFIKAELWRGSSDRVLNRIQTEARVGQVLFDAVAVGALEAGILKANQLVQRYRPPSAAVYQKGFVDPEGYWVDIYDNYFTLGYNTTLVSKAEVPGSWTDLLSPRWKGKIAIDTENYVWWMALQESWGEERAMQFARSLVTQDIQWRKGLTLIANLLAAGEFPLAVVSVNTIEVLKKKKAPAEWVTTMDPLPAEVHPIMVAARAQNPYAAKLFVEFVVSREGQTLIGKMQRIPAHPEVQLDWSADPRTLKLHGVGVVGPDHASRIIMQWRTIFRPMGP